MSTRFLQLLTLLIIFALNTGPAFTQDVIDVTDQTIKISAGKEETLYFGFARGDKIVFNFEEMDRKELKEIEVLEYPNTSKFSDFKTAKIAEKTFAVSKNSIYIFRFKNTSLSGRVCKIKIGRVAANESTQAYNPSVSWVIKEDTSWSTLTKDVIIGYDTTYQQKTKKELLSTEQREELIINKVQRVHSTTNANGNKTWLFFNLPQNTITANSTKKVVSWAYWVGVGAESNEAWKENSKAVSNLVKTSASYFTTPFGGLAIGAVADLMIPKIGEDVTYYITDQQNKDLFMNNYQFRLYDQGKGVAGYKKFTSPAFSQGTFFICMSNDNRLQGIDVDVKVVAIVETKVYQEKSYSEMVIKQKKEKQLYKEPIISKSRIPIAG